MFEQSMMDGRKPRAWTVSVSTGIQLGVIGAALLVPLLRVEALPPARNGDPVEIALAIEVHFTLRQ